HEWPGFFRRYLVGNRRKCFRRCNHVFGVASIVVDTCHLAMNAHVEVTAAACLANEIMTAMPAYADALAFFPSCNSLTGSINPASNFVTWYPRILQAWPEPFLHQLIAVADSAGFHFYPHLSGAWFGNIAFNQLKIAAWFANLGHCHFGFHFVRFLIWGSRPGIESITSPSPRIDTRSSDCTAK